MYMILQFTSGHCVFLDDDSFLIIILVITLLPILRLVPLTLTSVPPLTGPNDGLTDTTVGVMNWNCTALLAATVPLERLTLTVTVSFLSVVSLGSILIVHIILFPT